MQAGEAGDGVGVAGDIWIGEASPLTCLVGPSSCKPRPAPSEHAEELTACPRIQEARDLSGADLWKRIPIQ